MIVCKRCGLNPNSTQDEEQQRWETEYIKEHGICSACVNEITETKQENDNWIEEKGKWRYKGFDTDTKIRLPTNEEYAQLKQFFINERGTNKDNAHHMIQSYYYVVIENYSSDCPNYAGRVMFALYGNPDFYEMFIWGLNGEIKSVKQDVALSGGDTTSPQQMAERFIQEHNYTKEDFEDTDVSNDIEKELILWLEQEIDTEYKDEILTHIYRLLNIK